MTIGAVWAQTVSGVIGADNGLPWNLPEDMKHFTETTKDSTVVMGRKTWESLPEKFRPLPHRRNLVVSRNPGLLTVEAFPNLEEAFTAAKGETVWVIGGGQVYEQCMDFVTVIERTVIRSSAAGDSYAPLIPGRFEFSNGTSWLTSSQGLEYRFETWVSSTSPKKV